MPRLSANLSLLYAHEPVLDRFDAARRDGFTDVETWWPFSTAAPQPAEVDTFLSRLERAGARLRALNLYAGDMAAGARGVLSLPASVTDFRDNVAVVKRIAEATGCRHFNALYGQRQGEDAVTAEEQDRVAAANLAFAGAELAALDGVVLLEALKSPDNGAYPLTSLDAADAVRERTIREHGTTNIALLFDTFHLAGNGWNLIADARHFAGRIGHVQYADFPGRGAPGTGDIDFSAVTRALVESGYDGFIGCEFIPGDNRPNHNEIMTAIGA